MFHFLHLTSRIRLSRLAYLHPCLFYAFMFLAVPLGIICTVSLISVATMLPISLLMGWI